MLNGIIRNTHVLVLAGLLSTAAPADDGLTSAQDAWYEGRLPILRSQQDPARSRGWLLTPRGIAVFDDKAGKTVAFVELPGWTWASEAYLCSPDLALGPRGEAIVSSNVVPSLWRIDPVSLHVTRHDLVIDAHRDKDVGFTGIAYFAELDVYFAVSDFGALWRIDPLLRRAQETLLSQPLHRACALSSLARSSGQRRLSRLPGLCVYAGGKPWRVHLAPDQRSGYVRERCN